MSYEVFGVRHLFIHQEVFAEGLERIDEPLRLTDKTDYDCVAHLTHELRSALRLLLWLRQTREDIYCDAVQLQQVVCKGTIGHLKQANLMDFEGQDPQKSKRNLGLLWC